MRFRDLVPWKSQRPRDESSDSTMLSLQKEINKIFEGVIASRFASDWMPFKHFGESSSVFSPNINVHETSENIIVYAEVPGLMEEDFDIEITDSQLVLQGEKRVIEQQQEGDVYYQEIAHGSFQRTIPLDVKVDQDSIQADLRNGLLTITLPKAETEGKSARKISVKTEG